MSLVYILILFTQLQFYLSILSIGRVGGVNYKVDSKSKRISESKSDFASEQIVKWGKEHKKVRARVDSGAPYPSLTATNGVGKTGPLLLRDINYINNLGAFTNERISERPVHAKGSGAHGYFKVTNKDIAKYTGAKLFSKAGKKTQVTVRFSTVSGESGSADTVRDGRGFAVKFYTEEGNYDLMMFSTPVFGINDPILLPAFSRSKKRNPATHLTDYNMFWDFAAQRPESTFNTFLDLAYFKNYRVMQGFAISSYLWTRGSSNEEYFVRYHMIPTLKKSILTMEEYDQLAGSDPDYQTRDLYNAIGNKKYPKYTLFVQILTKDRAKTLNFNPFDATKLLPTKDFPLVRVGVLTLNKNPTDYFNEVEQVGFNPGNLVPGIEFSPDRLLHGRPFAYQSAQRHRMGTNFGQLPINSPQGLKARSYNRDGIMNIYGNGDGAANYFPNSYNGPFVDEKYEDVKVNISGGQIGRFDTGDDDNYSQLNDYWNDVMSRGEKKRTIRAIAAHLSKAEKRIQESSLEKNWDPVNDEISRMLRVELAKYNRN